jgi:Rac GTPase-activating protein 1
LGRGGLEYKTKENVKLRKVKWGWFCCGLSITGYFFVQEKFLRGRGVPNLSDIDIHTVCCTIKDFLRSLLEPLVTPTLRQDFVNAALTSDPDDARAAMIQAISELPQPNRDTLAFLILHLQR